MNFGMKIKPRSKNRIKSCNRVLIDRVVANTDRTDQKISQDL